MQGRGMMMGFAPDQPSPNQTVAAFLIARGPYVAVLFGNPYWPF
jgi:hypothetical protein